MQISLKVSESDMKNAINGFSQAGEEVKGVNSAVTNIISGVTGAWQGTDATAFQAKLETLVQATNTAQAKLEEYVQELNTAVANYSAANTEANAAVNALEDAVL